jgi:hypothetical protein
VTTKPLVAIPRDGGRRGDSNGQPRLTQAARDGAMEAWLEILSQRHRNVVWIPKRALDREAERS